MTSAVIVGRVGKTAAVRGGSSGEEGGVCLGLDCRLNVQGNCGVLSGSV